MPKWFSSFACHHRVPSEQFLPKWILPQLDLVKGLTWNSVVLEFLHWSMTDRTIKSSESYVPRHGDDCGAVCILPHLGCTVMESWLHWSPKLQHAEHSQTRAPITCFMYIHTYIYIIWTLFIFDPHVSMHTLSILIAINSWHWCKNVCNYVKCTVKLKVSRLYVQDRASTAQLHFFLALCWRCLPVYAVT